MADASPTDWVSAISAAIGILLGAPSAIVAYRQARSAKADRKAADEQAAIAKGHAEAAQASAEAAKRLAEAAEQQIELGKQHLDEMRKANAREMEAREDAKLQNTVQLQFEVKCKVDPVADEIRLSVVVHNKGRAEAVIQRIYIQHEDGTQYSNGTVYGTTKALNMDAEQSRLPGKLAYGGSFTFHFTRVGGGINVSRNNPTFKRDKIVRMVIATPDKEYEDTGSWITELRNK